MLIKLLRIRLTSMFTEKREAGKRKRNVGLLYAILMIYCAVVFGGLFFASYSQIFDMYCGDAGLDWLYFSLSITTGVMLAFIGSVFITQSQLFDAKDNELLLSMPIKPSVILMSRLLTLYLWGFFFSLISMGPALIVYQMGKGLGAAGLVTFVLELFLVPLFSLAASVLMAWILQFFSQFVKNKSIFVIIGTFLFLGLYLIAVNKLESFTTYLAENGAAVGDLYRTKLYPFFACGMAMIEPGINTLVMVLVTLIPFVIVFVILSKNFFNLITTKRATARTEYKAGHLEASSPVKAIVKKEMTRFIKSSTYAVNGATGLLMQIVLAIVLIVKQDLLLGIFEGAFGGDRSQALMASLSIIMVAFAAIITEITICSINMEGKMLWILKSAPISTYDILRGKVYAHLIIALPFALVAGIILNIGLSMNLLERLLAIAVPLLLQAFNAYFGLAVNLKYPKLDWTNEAYAVKQSTAVMIGALGGMGLFVIMIFFTFFAGAYITYDGVLILVAVILALGTLLYAKYLKGKGIERFEEL